jgi:O-antigen/teichoic acid export membrane protein
MGRRFFLARGPWFLLERLIAQAGGLALIALLARTYPASEAAGFIAAYALAAIAQPLFANACQPVMIRWVQAGRMSAARDLLFCLLAISGLLGGGAMVLCLLAERSVLALMLAHVIAAPLMLSGAPLIARDRWQLVLSVTIPVSLVGCATRLAVALAGGELWHVAGLLAVEPVFGGLALARRSGMLRGGIPRISTRAMLLEAAPLVTAMAASSFFWRSPVLATSLFLRPEEVLLVAFGMQLVTGMLLLPNALCQSLIGMIAIGGQTARAALAAGGTVVTVFGIGALVGAAVFGEWVLRLIYGAAAEDAGAVLLLLSPLVYLGGLWRLAEMGAALAGLTRSLLLTRLAALAGQAISLIALARWQMVEGIAAGSVLSLAFAALLLPLLLHEMRGVFSDIMRGVPAIVSGAGLRASCAVFLRT